MTGRVQRGRLRLGSGKLGTQRLVACLCTRELRRTSLLGVQRRNACADALDVRAARLERGRRLGVLACACRMGRVEARAARAELCEPRLKVRARIRGRVREVLERAVGLCLFAAEGAALRLELRRVERNLLKLRTRSDKLFLGRRGCGVLPRKLGAPRI